MSKAREMDQLQEELYDDYSIGDDHDYDFDEQYEDYEDIDCHIEDDLVGMMLGQQKPQDEKAEYDDDEDEDPEIEKWRQEDRLEEEGVIRKEKEQTKKTLVLE